MLPEEIEGPVPHFPHAETSSHERLAILPGGVESPDSFEELEQIMAVLTMNRLCSQPALGLDMVSGILTKCSENELLFLLDAVRSALEDERPSKHDDLVYGFLRLRNELSTAGRFLFLRVLQFSRQRQDRSLSERLNAGRQIMAFKEELLAQVRSRCGDGGDVRASNAGHAVCPCSVPATVIGIYSDFLKRIPLGEAFAGWANKLRNTLPFQRFLKLPQSSSNSQKCADVLPVCSNGRFIQFLYEAFHGRAALAWEIDHWQRSLESGRLSRGDILRQWFEEAFSRFSEERIDGLHNPQVFQIFGSSDRVTMDDWLERAELLEKSEPVSQPLQSGFSRFYIKTRPSVLVTAIASVYKGGMYIRQFLENITSQTIFKDYCELIIVDANSPENEYIEIEKYTKQHNNIIYKHTKHRIGVYEAWNLAVEASSGEYLTNTNVDDLRRADSFELQASVLDNLPFVDVVYQDFYYTFDPGLPFAKIAALGYKSNLPIITPYNMMNFNSPHNAPMWRKSLHGELGAFDVSFQAAGDYEFWIRCLVAGKTFYKLNKPMVAYYQNPEGLSTKTDTKALRESRSILKNYAHQLISSNLVSDRTEYLSQIGFAVPGPLRGGSRFHDAQIALRGMAADFKRGSHAVTDELHETVD